MMRILIFIILVFSVLSVSAQDKFEWKGLKFEETSIDKTLDLFGKPNKDKVEKPKIDKAVAGQVPVELNFRKFQYKNIDIYKEIYLLFLNEKLIAFEFIPQKQKMAAADLPKNFNADFLFAEGNNIEIRFKDLEGQKETSIPKVYPTNYYMIAVKEHYSIVATIDNSSWKAVLRDATNKPTSDKFPGFVKTMQVISRSVEKK